MPKNSKTTLRARPGPAARKQKSPRSLHGRVAVGATPHRKSGTGTAGKSGAEPGVQPAEKSATNFTFYVNPALTLVCVPSDGNALFSLAAAADLTGVHPEMLRYYCRSGLLGEARAGLGHEPTFDEDALHEVRRIEHYRRHLAVSRRALPLVCELQREAERQHIEIHFLRYP